jgi:TolA-binding protein
MCCACAAAQEVINFGKMDKKKYNDSPDRRFDEPTFSEVFAKESVADPSVRDVFAGDSRRFRGIGRPALLADASVRRRGAGGLPFMHIFLAVNLVVITALLCYLVFRPPVIGVAGAGVGSSPTTVSRPPMQTERPQTISRPSPSPQQPVNEAQAEQPVSLQTAEMLYHSGDYERAFHVFARLADYLPVNAEENAALLDYIQLKMALCIENMPGSQNSGPFFTAALQSRSPLVRALANYRLALIENRNRQFMDVRKRAYRTIALLRAFENRFPHSLDADCYFLAAEALTRQVLVLNNAPDQLPGLLWSDSLRAEIVPLMEQADLRALLQTGIAELTAGAAGPQVHKQEHLSVGVRWSAVALEARLEELAARIASTAQMDLVWGGGSDGIRSKAVTMYVPNSSEQFVAEVAAGAAGAVARFDSQAITLYDPQSFGNLSQYRDLLTSEAISMWRRFTLRYRGDHRMANAHYALGLLLDYAGQTGSALGEYKLVASRYSSNPLAPFALLNASIIKTNLRDYTGARQDLTELIIQYPDCKVIDTASLYLAEATMQAGMYDEAIKIYKRVYNLDLNNHSRREAAYGLGRCYVEMKDYGEAAKWFASTIELTQGSPDQRLRNANFMLGQCCIKLNRFAEASKALVNAIDNNASREEFVQVILGLVKAEVGRGNYVAALNVLENVPLERLSQEDSCAVLRATTNILLEIDLAETAITLLRRRIEFIADSTLRAQLNFELARCYDAANDLQLARKEVGEALVDLPAGPERQRACLLFADLCLRLKDYGQAADACIQLLGEQIDEKDVIARAHEILGACYANMNQYEKAALAYAGIHDMNGVLTKP